MEFLMLNLKVSDMTCGHCASTVTKAVKQVDGNATVEVDLGSKRVSIASTLDAAKFEQAIREAGYTPQPVA
jgi:copper chaperone